MAIIRANNNTLSSVTALPFATGGFVKLLSLTGGTTSQSSYDVDSTYINSTYDNYKIIAGYTHPTDNKYVYIRFFVGGTIKEADYSYENGANTSSTYSYDAYDATSMSIGGAGGNSTGANLETHTLCFDLTNVNSTTVATRIHGFHYGGATNANTVGYCFNCGQDTNSATDVVNGIRIYMGGDNIVMRHFAIYGLTK